MSTPPSASSATPANISLARIYRAKRQLEQRLADVGKEHRERIKRLKQAAETLEGRVLDQNLTLVSDELEFSPELLALIDRPTDGL